MATPRKCASPDEMWDAWKTGLLVDRAGHPACDYDYYVRDIDPSITKQELWWGDSDNLFILVEDEED